MWLPNDDWYETLFDDCKSKSEVVEQARRMIKTRDEQAYKKFNETIEMLRGHRCALEFIDEMHY